jgi:hypothetical protein
MQQYLKKDNRGVATSMCKDGDRSLLRASAISVPGILDPDTL